MLYMYMYANICHYMIIAACLPFVLAKVNQTSACVTPSKLHFITVIGAINNW